MQFVAVLPSECITTVKYEYMIVPVCIKMCRLGVFNFFIIKPTRCTNFTNLFRHETLHVSDIFSVHHQEFIHCTLSNGIVLCHTGLYTAFEQEQDGLLRKLSTNLYDIHHC